MFEILDQRTSLTGNQIKILTAAIIGADAWGRLASQPSI
jgi:hypothetical protein